MAVVVDFLRCNKVILPLSIFLGFPKFSSEVSLHGKFLMFSEFYFEELVNSQKNLRIKKHTKNVLEELWLSCSTKAQRKWLVSEPPNLWSPKDCDIILVYSITGNHTSKLVSGYYYQGVDPTNYVNSKLEGLPGKWKTMVQ